MLDLKNLVAVSGKSGLFRLAGNRKDGLIIEDIDTGKRTFASSREHQFTPLEGISIYSHTEDGATLLAEVFGSMRDMAADTPPVDHKADTKKIVAYFEKALPNYDADQVKVSDMRKAIRWFAFLLERNLLKDLPEETPAAEEKASEQEEKSGEA